MNELCDICSKDINPSSLSFFCDFCQRWFHHECNLPCFPNANIKVGSCLECNCKLFPLSICHDITTGDASLNYLHFQFRPLIPFENQSFGNNLDVTCRYIDCDDFKSTFSAKYSRDLSFLHLNICSLSKNFDAFNYFLDSIDYNFGIIGISETRILGTSIPHNLNLPNYTSFFTKTEASAGGTAIYVSNDYDFKARDDLSCKLYSSRELEATFCELELKGQTNVIVGCIYKHPNMDTEIFSNNFFYSFPPACGKGK